MMRSALRSHKASLEFGGPAKARLGDLFDLEAGVTEPDIYLYVVVLSGRDKFLLVEGHSEFGKEVGRNPALALWFRQAGEETQILLARSLYSINNFSLVTHHDWRPNEADNGIAVQRQRSCPLQRLVRRDYISDPWLQDTLF